MVFEIFIRHSFTGIAGAVFGGGPLAVQEPRRYAFAAVFGSAALRKFLVQSNWPHFWA